MECVACNSKFTTIEYQARAADEAQTVIETCPKCPLDASKLTLEWKEEAHTHLETMLRKEESTPIAEVHSLHKMHMIYIKCGHPPGVPEHARCCNILCENLLLYRLYDTGPFKGSCVREEQMKLIGPEIEFHTFHIGKVKHKLLSTYLHFEYLPPGKNNYMHVEMCNVWYRIVEVEEHNFNQQSLILREAYTNLVLLESLSDYIPQMSLGSMSNLSSRGYDLNEVEDSQYSFAVKADGERMWLTLIGCTWLYSRRLLGHKIVGWCVDEEMLSLHNTSYGPVLDVEIFINHKPVLIDVLMTPDSSITPKDRNIKWVHNKFHDMAKDIKYLNTIQTRTLYNSYSEAVSACNSAPYSTDGVVALHHDGIDIVKLKTIKSMELEATPGGDMVSSEGTKILNVSSEHSCEPGSIYEIGMYMQDAKCVFTHIFRRPDKTKANSVAAIRSIIESSLPQQKNKALRTQLWRWSNKARENLYKLAHKRMPGRRLILDIGSGDGQSCDVHAKMPDCSFILVEPDESKCNKLMKRLQLRSYVKDIRSLIRKVAPLKKGTNKYCIINCKLESILEDKDVCDMLLPELKCCVACFSLQFVLSSIETLCSYSVCTIGMCYVYDGVEVGGSIINSGDISMTKISECVAQVKWGTDAIYEEPAIERSDFPPGAVLFNIKSLIDLPSGPGDSVHATNLMDKLLVCIFN